MINMIVGQTLILSGTMQPTNATHGANPISWTRVSGGITVNGNEVTAISNGPAIIRATVVQGDAGCPQSYTQDFNITVGVPANTCGGGLLFLQSPGQSDRQIPINTSTVTTLNSSDGILMKNDTGVALRFSIDAINLGGTTSITTAPITIDVPANSFSAFVNYTTIQSVISNRGSFERGTIHEFIVRSFEGGSPREFVIKSFVPGSDTLVGECYIQISLAPPPPPPLLCDAWELISISGFMDFYTSGPNNTWPGGWAQGQISLVARDFAVQSTWQFSAGLQSFNFEERSGRLRSSPGTNSLDATFQDGTWTNITIFNPASSSPSSSTLDQSLTAVWSAIGEKRTSNPAGNPNWIEGWVLRDVSCGGLSSIIPPTTPPPEPPVVHEAVPPPWDLRVSDVDLTELTLNWRAPTIIPSGMTITGYEIQMSTNLITWSNISGHSGLNFSFDGITSGRALRLAQNTQYHFRVISLTATDRSIPSNVATERTARARPVAVFSGTCTSTPVGGGVQSNRNIMSGTITITNPNGALGNFRMTNPSSAGILSVQASGGATFSTNGQFTFPIPTNTVPQVNVNNYRITYTYHHQWDHINPSTCNVTIADN